MNYKKTLSMLSLFLIIFIALSPATASASILGNIFHTSDADFNGTTSQTQVSSNSVILALDPNPRTYNFTGSTNDGAIWGGPVSSYATARDVATTFNPSARSNRVGQFYSSSVSKYTVYRLFLLFDTSAIPDGDIVTQVNLKLKATTDSSGTDFDVQIVKQNWSGQDPLDTGNMDAAFDGCLAGTLDDNIWRNTSGMSTDVQYASGNLSTAWINKTGSTYYSLRSKRDKDANTPGGIEHIEVGLQDHENETYRPKLTVLATGDYYYSSGTYTSPIFQRQQVASWGNMNWNATINSNTSLTIKARTCTYPDCHDRDWNCGDIDTGAAQGGAGVSLKSGSPNCVSDSQKYIQYQATLNSTDGVNTPYLNDILLDYQYNPDQSSMWGTVKFFGSMTFK